MNISQFCLAFLAFFFLFFTHRLESYFRWTDALSLEETEELSFLIRERILEIESLNAIWRPFIEKENQRNQEFLSHFWSTFSMGDLVLEPEGAAATYTLYNCEKKPCFIIKPTDGCVFCLHNPKHYASPFIESPYRIKNHIPLYRSAQTDACCYELAKLCNLEHVTPKTVISLLSHPQFFYIYPENEKHEIKEKLCSIQEYLTDTISLRTVLQELFTFHLSEEKIQSRFDQENFEDLVLFLWLTADTDAHVGNFRAYLKNISLEGAPIYGLIKIDNSLSLPDANLRFSNALMYFPNALIPLSSRTRSHIQSLPLQEIQETMRTFHLESAYLAFEERISTLQKIIEKKDITYYECSLRLALLATREGKELALKNCSLKCLEYMTKDLIKPHQFTWAENN